MHDKQKINPYINRAIDSIGLVIIGLFSLGYLLFAKRFAELHINFSFLDFPIFIGEILLFLCLILLATKWKINRQKFNIRHCLLFSYLGFVLIKAFWGYFEWGPFAFRHSALFYYPLFAVCGYTFYRRNFFSNKKNLLIATLLIFIPRFLPFYNYALVTCFILAFVLIKAYPHKLLRYVFISLLLIFTPYQIFFYTSRTFLVSNMAVGVYIMVVLFFVLRAKKSHKLILSILLMLFMVMGVLKIADKTGVESITNFGQMMDLYNENSKYITEKSGDFKMREFKERKIYNPEFKTAKTAPLTGKEMQTRIQDAQYRIKELHLKISEIEGKVKKLQANIIKKAQPEIEKIPSEVKITQTIQPTIEKPQADVMKKAQFEIKKRKSEIEELQIQIKGMQSKIEKAQVQRPSLRGISRAYNNSLFRIFIWRDMLTQLKEEMPFSLLGFNFGKPVRSKSIEILGWAGGEWKRDGWIAPHNSYIHIIYRAGFMGIIFVLSIFILLFAMIKKSLRFNLISGVLLCGILINWLVAANFLVILELPYNAIPFWSLFGMTFAYLNKESKGRFSDE